MAAQEEDRIAYRRALGRRLQPNALGAGIAGPTFLRVRAITLARMAEGSAADTGVLDADQQPAWLRNFIAREATLCAWTARVAEDTVRAGSVDDNHAAAFVTGVADETLAWATVSAEQWAPACRILPVFVAGGPERPIRHHYLFVELVRLGTPERPWLRVSVDDSTPYPWSTVTPHHHRSRRRITTTQFALPTTALGFATTSASLADLVNVVAPDRPTFDRRLARLRDAVSAYRIGEGERFLDGSRLPLTTQIGATCVVKNHNAGMRSRLAEAMTKQPGETGETGDRLPAAWRRLRAIERLAAGAEGMPQ